MPVIIAISTIITVDDSEYSVQRKKFRSLASPARYRSNVWGSAMNP
jgi:hypothetical protein